MIRGLPAETVDAEFLGEAPRQVHLPIAVVPPEQNVPPVDEGHVASATVLRLGDPSHVVEGHREVAALAVAGVRLLRGSVDRERVLINARRGQPADGVAAECQTVGAGVEMDVRVPLP